MRLLQGLLFLKLGDGLASLRFQICVLEDKENETVDQDFERVLRCPLRLALRVCPKDCPQVSQYVLD